MKPIYIPGFPGREIHFNNRYYLYFGGTSYLGMQTLPQFQQLLIDEIQRYGTNYGASRISNIRLDIYDKTEEYLSNWVGSEACIVLSSGFLAGQLLAKYFNKKDYKLFYTTHTHASLFSNDRTTCADYDQLSQALKSHLKTGNKRIPVVFLDTIDFSPDTYPDYNGLNGLPLESCILIADDSHGIGLLGPNGSGAYRCLRELSSKELLVCGSLGKSLGVQGGAVFGNRSRLEGLRKTSIFAGASPPPPAYMSALLRATPLYASQRSILFTLLEKFHKSLNNPDRFRFLLGYPVYESDDHKLFSYLRHQGIWATDFDYVAENDSRQCRLVISAGHRPEDISMLVEKINNYYR